MFLAALCKTLSLPRPCITSVWAHKCTLVKLPVCGTRAALTYVIPVLVIAFGTHMSRLTFDVHAKWDAVVTRRVNRQLPLALHDALPGSSSLPPSLTPNATAQALSIPDLALEQSGVKPSQCNKELQPVWLATYPNSGTTYTIDLVGMLTQTATATVYGSECRLDGCLASELGPYSTLIKKTALSKRKHRHHNTTFNCTCMRDDKVGWVSTHVGKTRIDLPCGKVLVKTHCGGYGFSLNNEQLGRARKNANHMTSLHTKHAQKHAAGKSLGTLHKLGTMCSSGDTKMDLDTFARCCGSGNLVFERFQPPGNLLGIVHLWRDPTDNLMSRFHHERLENG